jgi:hypothetical protein
MKARPECLNLRFRIWKMIQHRLKGIAKALAILAFSSPFNNHKSHSNMKTIAFE